MSNQQEMQEQVERKGLYTGNVILELIPDSKGVKPAFKVNNLATEKEMDDALTNFMYLSKNVHVILHENDLPITYEQAVEEAKKKTKGEKNVE